MQFIGEHAFLQILGKLAIYISFTASILALYAYWKAQNTSSDFLISKSFRNLGRYSFYTQAFCIVGIFSILFYALATHKYEFYYVFNHSSNNLEPKYLLSCFWEGMEGSFLLWSFWNSVLGIIITRTAKEWEVPVMIVFAATQIITASFTLGIYIGDLKIGSNPFTLLRHELSAPIFSQANYLAQIKDGNGLNALLQNYWMVIHPPILFLGFSSVLVPFAYATASLINGKVTEWIKPVLPWALFSTGVLGLGIMMGAMWAYESLTFGGFWAWDPVENASMVPWLVAVAGVHTALVYKSTGRSLLSTYIFMTLAYVLVLYSSFLTKSGILQNSSVHAFTDKGATVFYHLLLKVILYLGFPTYLIIRNFKKIPIIKKEEHISAREFWMFMGSLLFFISALVIIIQTSWPALSNSLTENNTAMGENQEYQYNKIQIWVALFAALFTAIAQYLKYKETSKTFFYKKIMGPTIAAVVISILISAFGGITFFKHGAGFLVAIHAAIFAAVYTTVANASYLFIALKGKLKNAGGSIAHVGFGLLLLGILIASAKKTVVSYDTTLLSQTIIKENPNEKAEENITLVKSLKVPIGKNIFAKGNNIFNNDTLAGHKYVVSYTGKYSENNKTFFNIDFNNIKTGEKFTLKPDVIENNKGNEGVSPNPDAKHYWNKDLFVYLTFISEPDATKDTSQFKNVEFSKGDSTFYSKGTIILEGTTIDKINSDSIKLGFIVTANLKIIDSSGQSYMAKPKFEVRNETIFSTADSIIPQNLAFKFINILPEKNKFVIGIKESTAITDFVTAKIYEFPFINAVWIGTLLIVIGFLLSAFQRAKQLWLKRKVV
jgi:cytochrome c-type biogenesis protein CcmF